MPAHFRGIDGLRALAILGVIAFHTRPSLLQGGFIGVTMFFVITGFLATRSVLNMVDRTGSFGYGRYLIRRITRLWPVMLATIAVVPWLTWMFAPSLLQKVVSDSLPDALFASNWVYIFRKVPYFEAAGLPSPLTHLWFLGVTMQFYLVWPLLMVVLGKITKSKWVRSMAILVIMAASTADMVLLFDPANTSRVYYGTDTRLAELSAVLLNCALLVLIRYYIIICQAIGSDFPNRLLLIFGMLSVAVAAFFILVQRDIKRLLAYSSVENMGLIAVALGIGGPLGIFAALLHTLNHSLAKTLLFCGSGNVLLKYGTRDLNVVCGMLRIRVEQLRDGTVLEHGANGAGQ